MMSMKKKYIYEAIIVIAIVAVGVIFWRMQEKIGSNGGNSTSSATAENKTYHNESEGIEFKYPADVTAEGGANIYSPELYISRIRYRTSNVDPKNFYITIASTTIKDLKNLKFDYQKGLSKDNPEYNSLTMNPSVTGVIKSSEMITVRGIPALKEVVSGAESASSTYTWIHVINKGKLYSLEYGIERGYDNSQYKATPQDEAKLQQYVDLFLSTVKFF